MFLPIALVIVTFLLGAGFIGLMLMFLAPWR